jgi:hypothetical protein
MNNIVYDVGIKILNEYCWFYDKLIFIRVINKYWNNLAKNPRAWSSITEKESSDLRIKSISMNYTNWSFLQGLRSLNVDLDEQFFYMLFRHVIFNNLPLHISKLYIPGNSNSGDEFSLITKLGSKLKTFEFKDYNIFRLCALYSATTYINLESFCFVESKTRTGDSGIVNYTRFNLFTNSLHTIELYLTCWDVTSIIFANILFKTATNVKNVVISNLHIKYLKYIHMMYKTNDGIDRISYLRIPDSCEQLRMNFNNINHSGYIQLPKSLSSLYLDFACGGLFDYCELPYLHKVHDFWIKFYQINNKIERVTLHYYDDGTYHIRCLKTLYFFICYLLEHCVTLKVIRCIQTINGVTMNWELTSEDRKDIFNRGLESRLTSNYHSVQIQGIEIYNIK